MSDDASFLHHSACEGCGSSDGKAVYSDGTGYCFVCSRYYRASGAMSKEGPIPEVSQAPKNAALIAVTPSPETWHAIPDRKLTRDSAALYRIDSNQDEDVDVAHRYPYYRNGVHVANKVRRRSVKDFRWEGDPSGCGLFGQQAFPAGSAKAITLVEGELDAPSVHQLSGSKYPVVAVPSTGHAVKSVKTNYEYLDSFEEIVVCFDNDEAGQIAAKKVAELFRPGKCRILSLQQGKDPSDYLTSGVPAASFVSEWWKAPTFRPDGIVAGTSMWDVINNPPSYFSIPYPWEGLNDATYGIRTSELHLFMADTGVGKTAIFKAIAHSILTNEAVKELEYGVGFLHLEETNYDTALGLLSIHNSKPYHLPDTPRDEAELRTAYDELLNNERVLFYDHFGSNGIDEIVAKVRYMAVMGCKYIFLDHLSIIVSDQSGDERKQLDEISTKLKTLTMELDIALFCVIHTNRSGEARGSAGPEKVANNHFSLDRSKKDPDPWRRNVTTITVEKCRLTGRGGPFLWLFYDAKTGRLEEMDQDMIDIYEGGGSPGSIGGDLPWKSSD